MSTSPTMPFPWKPLPYKTNGELTPYTNYSHLKLRKKENNTSTNSKCIASSPSNIYKPNCYTNSTQFLNKLPPPPNSHKKFLKIDNIYFLPTLPQPAPSQILHMPINNNHDFTHPSDILGAAHPRNSWNPNNHQKRTWPAQSIKTHYLYQWNNTQGNTQICWEEFELIKDNVMLDHNLLHFIKYDNVTFTKQT